MTTCDQAGCPARATREVILDSGHSLWFCAHDADHYFPLPPELRFSAEVCEITT